MTVQLGFPRQPFLELYLAGEWQNVITDVRQTTPIKLERARKSEQSKPTPSELTFVLDDSADHGNGNYSPRNPMGDYYPDFGRNVPVRFGYELAEDDFNRVSSSGWQGEWVNGRSSGGVIADTDWTVTGTVARHIVPNQNQFRGSTYNGIRLRNAEQRYTWTRPALNVTGGVYTTIAQFRIQDPTFTTLNYCYVEFYVDTAENLNCIAVEVVNGSGALIGDAATLVTASPQTVNIVCNLEGNTFRVKAWDPANPEPLDWQRTMVGVNTIQAPGEMGIISRVDTANTNVDPHTFEYENWSARAVRFTGETSTVVPEMDLSENIRICKVECGTLFRRHEQGESPEQSALRRFIETKADTWGLFGYWPCEDEKFTSTTIASGIEDGPVMLIGGGLDPNSLYGGGLGTGTNTTKWADNDDLAASAPLPTVNITTWRAYLTDFTALGRYDLRWYMSGENQDVIAVWAIEIFTWGSSANRWLINLPQWSGSGEIRGYIQAYDLNGNILVDDNGGIGYPDVAGKPALWYFQLAQNGANIDYNLGYLKVGDTAVTNYIAGTVAGRTLSRIVSVGMISGGAGLATPENRRVGHIMVGGTQVSSSNFFDPLAAFAGESACERLVRLLDENDLPPVGQTTSTVTSAAMGPQQVETLLDLLVECADTDHGFFYDSRSANSYSYIPLGTLYGRDAHVTLDNAAKHLGEGFAPTDDDATTVNDVTVKAKRGSSARQQATTGPLNTGDPGTGVGAVGRYDKSFTINPVSDDQLAQSAGWVLHLGTTDESRFPEISVDLAADAFDDLDLAASILDLDVGDVIGIANLQNWYVFDEPKQIVLGYTEIMQDQNQHSISFNTAPYSPYNVGSLGDHEIRLDSSDSSLSIGIDSTDTIFDVSTPDTLTRWILSTTTDKILTGYYAALSGTTTTAVLNSASVREMNIGDQMQLHTVDGVLKEATTFSITNIVDNLSTATVTFSPAAAAAVVVTDKVRSWYSNNFNFDIMVGGERMTVTNVSLTEPQQFTVTRSVNGVVKPHLAGTKVELFKPYWLAK